MTLEIVGQGEKPVPVEDVSEDDDEDANDSELKDLLDNFHDSIRQLIFTTFEAGMEIATQKRV